METLKIIHPGEILKEEFLEQFNISAYKLAKDIGVPVNRITEIVNGQRSISAETGLLFSKYFGLSDGFWIRLQGRFDEEVAKERLAKKLASIIPINNPAIYPNL